MKYDIEKAIKNAGVMKVQEAINAGMKKDELYKELSKGDYERIAHGIYGKADAWIDEMQIISLRCPDAVFSHDEALYYHGLIDREPLQKTITLYTGYNPTRLKREGIKVYTVKKELLTLGRDVVTNTAGNLVPMYNLERTICDLVRSRNDFEIDVFKSALQSYVKRRDKDLNMLMEYAKQFRVDNVLRNYMEVLI